MSRATGPRRATAGDAMLHPVVVVAVLVMLANDHLWKEGWPGAVTGKLSDVAGLVFFPLLLASLAEVIRAGFGATVLPSRSLLGLWVAVTAVVFAAAEHPGR